MKKLLLLLISGNAMAASYIDQIETVQVGASASSYGEVAVGNASLHLELGSLFDKTGGEVYAQYGYSDYQPIETSFVRETVSFGMNGIYKPMIGSFRFFGGMKHVSSMNTIEGVRYDFTSIDAVGGLGNNWNNEEGFSMGVDWISVSQPLVVDSKSAVPERYLHDEAGIKLEFFKIKIGGSF